MAKYFNCPFNLSGKLGELVFVYRNGKRIVRMRPKPMKSTPFRKNKEMLFTIVVHLYQRLKHKIEYPWWLLGLKKFRNVHPSKINPRAIFMKYNIPQPYNSVPNLKEPLSRQNMADLTKIFITYNPDIPAPIIKKVIWKENIYIEWEYQKEEEPNIVIIYPALEEKLFPIEVIIPRILKKNTHSLYCNPHIPKNSATLFLFFSKGKRCSTSQALTISKSNSP